HSLLPRPVFKNNDYSGVTTILTQGGWANAQQYEAASTNAGSTTEQIKVNNPSAGWYYITLQSEGQSAGVALQVDLR
ncbi:PPC domain-containing protein, partial [Shewanella xiamenensis]|uniref:PPC domain-containing protein n=1 Tax=Shewanella xiamenensis TaxID=332186 RepID=UPI002E7BB7C1